MTPCCTELEKEGFITRGNGVYKCAACHQDISLLVLEMFLADPHGTVALKRKSGGAE